VGRAQDDRQAGRGVANWSAAAVSGMVERGGRRVIDRGCIPASIAEQ